MRHMSPKKAVLRTLHESLDQNGPESLVRPATIPGFTESPDKYQKTINGLLKDRLIEGMKDEDGRMAIAINPHKMEDVKRELRPLWAHPAVLAIMAVVMIALGVGLMG